MGQIYETSALKAVELPTVRFFSRTLLLCVYLPLFHLAFSILVAEPPVHRPTGLSNIPPLLMLWSFTASIALVLWVLEPGLVPIDSGLSTGQFIAKYFLVSLSCLLVLSLFYANIDELPNIEEDKRPIGLFMALTIEVLLSAVIRSVLQQQQLDHAVKMNLRAAQYQTLRAQLKPHFLFNSLNLVSSEIENDPKLAVELLDKLSELLRAALNATEKPLITLEKELDLLELYLEIQQRRFGDRLEYDIERWDAHSGYLLPPMLLQPLVENAIKHGIAPYKSGGKVSVKTEIRAELMVITINDNGGGFDQSNSSIGHGLELVRDSIELLYAPKIKPGNGAFSLSSVPGEGTTVTLRLPAKK